MTDVDPASLTPGESVEPPTDDAPRPPRAARRPAPRPAWPRSPLGALGVVFGDIGTSPLYALQTVFAADHHAVRPTQAGVYGVISLVFWTITIIVSIKYVTFIMRADNEGEGGIMALIALIQRGGVRLDRRAAKAALVALGIFGASLFYGDGMITPAISVLSAVEGLEVAAPSLESLVVPITLVILTVLFAIQRYGTGAVGRLFGPIMGLWFALLARVRPGQGRRAHPGSCARSRRPTGLSFLVRARHVAFIALGSVVLTVTGAEALYADMGHFGRPPIRRAWFAVVFPALILNYMGQGALILDTPRAIDNPFFLLFPHWARIPMVLAATAATVIASQAVISGAFSVTRQAVQLGFLPRLTIRHTSHEEVGQVYAPARQLGHLRRRRRPRRRLRLVGGAGLGLRHRRHRHPGHRHDAVLRRRAPPVAQAAVARRSPARALFLTVDLTFFAANLTKVLHGGWFPLSIALVDLRRADDVAARPRDRDAQPHRGGGPAARRSSTRSGNWTRRSTGRRAPASSSTPTSRPPRWRCGPTSSTTTPSTRASSSCRSRRCASRTSRETSA